MIRKHKGTLVVTSLVTLLPMLAGLLLWNFLPESLAVHWNTSYEIDGWASKLFVVVALPLFMLGVHWFCILCTAVDPKSKNIDSKPLKLALWICPLMSLAVHGFIYATALEISIPMEILLPLLLGAMFIALGNYMPKCKPNYTIGYKVSWALDDEANWAATHRFGGKVTVLGGILIMLTAFWGNPFLMMAILVPMIALPILYSYLYAKKYGAAA